MITWTTNEQPALDVIVLMRLDSTEFPVWPGYNNGEGWHPCGTVTIGPVRVTGWMPLDKAARKLDSARIIRK